MTNSRQFSLDYEVEALGPAAVEKVELWTTADGGRTWNRSQTDDDAPPQTENVVPFRAANHDSKTGGLNPAERNAFRDLGSRLSARLKGADELARGAENELNARRIEYERIAVPGSLEIPLALSLALANGFVGRAGRHRGCIALGCVIRGETSHYDIVARESAAGLHALAVEHAVPLGNGILTCDSREQALARASVSGRNKGGDAARACLALMQIEQHFSSASRR